MIATGVDAFDILFNAVGFFVMQRLLNFAAKNLLTKPDSVLHY